MKTKTVFSRYLVVAMMLFYYAFAKAQSVNTSYLCLANGDIVLADLGNCTTTVVASYSQSFLDIAQGNTDDMLYGIRDGELFEINVVTGMVNSLGLLNVVGFTGNFRVDSLVKESNGVLLGVHTDAPGTLFRIDVATMTATNIGDVGYSSAGDLTYLNGVLYLSADNNELVEVDVNNPANSQLVGTIPSAAGFTNVFGVVTIITANPCAANPTYELVATGGDDTRFLDPATSQLSVNCTNLVSSSIYGAAEVASDVICSIDLTITDNGNLNPEYCANANTTLTTTVDPATPIGVYAYEWSIQGQAGVVGTSAILPINTNTTMTYVCTVTDSGRAAPDNIATDVITVTVHLDPVWSPVANVVAHSLYTLPAITGTNIPANTAFYDNPGHTGASWNSGDTINPAMFAVNPATVYVYGVDANGCELEEQFEVDFVDAQVTIIPGGIQDVCAGDMVTLTATPTPATAYGMYSYNWSDSQGTVYPNTASITVTINQATTVSVTVNDSGVVNGTGMGFDMTDFTVQSAVDIDDIADQSANSNFTFPVITGTGLTASVAYYTQPNGMGIMYVQGDVVTASDFTTLPVTIYMYDDNGSCSDEESFVLDIIEPSSPTLNISSSTTDVCAGEPVVLTASPSPTTPQGTYVYQWVEQGSATVLSTVQSFTVSPAVTTIYECTVTDDGMSTNNSASDSITINVSPSPMIDVIADQTVTGNFTFPVISGSNLSGGESFYSEPNGQGIAYSPEDIVNIALYSVYPVTFYVYDINSDGCEDEVSFDVYLMTVPEEPEEPIVPDFTIPQYITPNGDGYHDYWQIEVNNTDVVVTGIFVFDRYGKLLKQLAPDGVGWDATYNNNSLPSSSYWYLINYKKAGVVKELRGFFALKR